jgi:hypothetical protein
MEGIGPSPDLTLDLTFAKDEMVRPSPLGPTQEIECHIRIVSVRLKYVKKKSPLDWGFRGRLSPPELTRSSLISLMYQSIKPKKNAFKLPTNQTPPTKLGVSFC